ncbi:unnamed protein product [Ranitomeya imitator]|uniref:SCP domain-containing protein n=1 Tax=Ranitomeya imitator TaxID=111125 RepID=A0ABN9LN73_9NEOB|nr:unnamed protein product [Ranitomeya imitator]
MTLIHIHPFLPGLLLWILQLSSSFVLASATELLHPSNSSDTDLMFGIGIPRNRRKRYISPRDMSTLLDYHNKVRSKVFPPAANMEYMFASVRRADAWRRPRTDVWDERLAKSAESWANQCKWDHGPNQLMRYIGQNLSIHSGRYRSVVDLVKAWYDERQHYSFPYPRECNPSCPSKCSGSVCSHYTQV